MMGAVVVVMVMVVMVPAAVVMVVMMMVVASKARAPPVRASSELHALRRWCFGETCIVGLQQSQSIGNGFEQIAIARRCRGLRRWRRHRLSTCYSGKRRSRS
jgi:hypothetical protein